MRSKIIKVLSYFPAKALGYDVKNLGDSIIISEGIGCKQESKIRKEYLKRRIIEEIEKKSINLVLDIGAHEGEYIEMLRGSGYHGRAISFEPVSTSYENLKKKSKGDDMWEVRNKAIGSTSSEKTIDVKKDTKFSSLLRVEKYTKGEFGDRVKNKDREVVPVERLENEIKTNKDSKIFLKVDVQGFEKEVWNGVGKLWKKVEIVQTEISTKRMYEDEEEWGYEVRELSERGFGMLGLFPVHRDSKTGEVVQYDCLMSKS